MHIYSSYVYENFYTNMFIYLGDKEENEMGCFLLKHGVY